jgi:hypothetical protein
MLVRGMGAMVKEVGVVSDDKVHGNVLVLKSE